LKKINFIFYRKHNSQLLLTEPVPAQSMIPRWYHEGESFISKGIEDLNVVRKEERRAGMKACMPLLDALTSGYMLRTWRDVEIVKNESNVIIFRNVIKNNDGEWIEDKTDNPYPSIVERPDELGYTIPRPEGHSFNQLVWESPWGWEVPKGWSVLVTHPLNRWDLPFTSISGFMESDSFVLNGGIPFFLKNEWTGIIEKGTPVAQLLPIKRDTWMAYYEKDATKKALSILKVLRSVPYGWYRNNMWIKKVYKVNELDNL
jgi:hypothetical protein